MTSCARYADLDFVERYVLGQMDEAEQSAYEAHFFECPDCFAAVQAMQTAQTALRESPSRSETNPEETNTLTSGRVVEFRDPAARGKGGESVAVKTAGSGGSKRMISGAAWIGLAAAASLAGVIVWAPWRGSSSPEPTNTVAQQTPPTVTPTPTPTPPTTEPKIDQPSGTGAAVKPKATRPPISLEALAIVMPPPYVPLQTRGTDTAPGEAFAAAMTKYSAKDYRGAIDALKPIADADPQSIPAQFFLGISHLALNEPAAASAVLNRVATSNIAPYADEAHFYLAKAAIGARDLDRAERELSIAIDRQAGPPSEAQKLQQAIRTYRREHNQD
jgi:anti-sigma factor RsiW